MADDVPDSAVLAPDVRVVTAEIDDETVLVHRDDGAPVLLDRVGTAVWRSFDGLRRVSQVIEHLCLVSGAPPQQVRAHVLAVAAGLSEAGFLRAHSRMSDPAHPGARAFPQVMSAPQPHSGDVIRVDGEGRRFLTRPPSP